MQKAAVSILKATYMNRFSQAKEKRKGLSSYNHTTTDIKRQMQQLEV